MIQLNDPKVMLQQMIDHISAIMAIMDMFEDSRPGSLAFTHLEEGMMWLQVLAHNIPLKPQNTGIVVEEITETVIDAEVVENDAV